MEVVTFREGIEDLVRQTMEVEKYLPEGVTVPKNVYEYNDVLGYQVMIIIGKDILQDDEDSFSDEDWEYLLDDEDRLFGDDYDEDYDDDEL